MRQRSTLESVTRWKSGDKAYTLFYERVSKLKHGAEPPRDFEDQFSSLLWSRPTIGEFEIVEVRRSTETGDFYYSNGELWVRESRLFDTKAAARHEHARIIKMLVRWIKDNQGR